MINFKQKEFGRNEKSDFCNTSESVIRDLIKLLVMGYHPKNANLHWIERTSSFTLDAGKGSLKTIPRANVFLGIATSKERTKANGIVSSEYTESPEEFIKRLWIDVATEKEKGNLKYQGMIKPTPTNQEIMEVLEKIRYILLCLTDQCIPENFSWDGEAFRIPIRFETSGFDKFKSTGGLMRRIIQIIQGMGLGITIKGVS